MNEINGQTAPPYTGPKVLYAIIRNQASQPWNNVDNVFENYQDGHVADYAVAMTQQGASGFWVADAPAAITAPGTYNYTVYLPAGSTPADGDSVLGLGSYTWPTGYVPPVPAGPGGNEILVKSPSTLPLYATIVNSANQYFNFQSSAFEAYSAGNWIHYALALSPLYIGSDNYWAADFPIAIVASDIYTYTINAQAGSVPAVGDAIIVTGYLNWSGSPQGIADSFVGLVQLKAYLGITASTWDGQLSALLPQASLAISNSVKRNLRLVAYQETYDGGGYSFLRLNNYPIVAITSITDTFTGNVYTANQLVWNSEGTVRAGFNKPIGGFPLGANRFIAAYQAGYGTIPQDLQLATLMYTQFLWRFSQKDPTVNSKKVGDVQIAYGKSLSGDFTDNIFMPVEAILQRYRQIPVL